MNNKITIKGMEIVKRLSGNNIAGSNIAVNLFFSLVFAILMAVSANSYIYLPFTPVPITIQVLTVLLSGLFLGSRWAFTSQVIYVLMGLMGLPVFAGFKNGVIALAGPTGGYIIGFMAAAFTAGYIYENSVKDNTGSISKLSISFISSIAGVVLIHLFGFIHLAGYFYSASADYSFIDILVKTWKLGTQPFLLIDFLKAAAAVLIINTVKNKK